MELPLHPPTGCFAIPRLVCLLHATPPPPDCRSVKPLRATFLMVMAPKSLLPLSIRPCFRPWLRVTVLNLSALLVERSSGAKVRASLPPSQGPSLASAGRSACTSSVFVAVPCNSGRSRTMKGIPWKVQSGSPQVFKVARIKARHVFGWADTPKTTPRIEHVRTANRLTISVCFL